MRALVVGAGRMGGFHRRVLMDLGLDVTTVDPCPAAGADYLSVPRRDFDAVCVSVPIEHLPIAVEFANRTDYLLVEKPMAPTEKVARQMACLMAGERAAVAVGYVERYNPVVRGVKAMLDYCREGDHHHPTSATFTRWNERPSEDALIDLQSHDVDLARFFGLDCAVTFDARAGVGVRRREVEIQGRSFAPLRYDLTAHHTSPLHAQWHAFLSGRPGYATPADAIGVLAALSGFPAEVTA